MPFKIPKKLSHFIEFRLVGWLGRLAPSDFKKISRWKADGHNISAYKKSSRYLKALKSYPILKFVGYDDDDDDNDDNDDDDVKKDLLEYRQYLLLIGKLL